MRNLIGKIYILSLTILTQTGCDKNDRAVAVIREAREIHPTVKLQTVQHADPGKSTPDLMNQRGIGQLILGQSTPEERRSTKAMGAH